MAAGQRRRGQRTDGLPDGRPLAVLKSAVLKSAVLKSGVPRQDVLRQDVLKSGVPKSGGRTQGDRHGTGQGPPAAHPVRRHRPVLRDTGHPAHRDPAAGRRPGRGRADAGGNLPRRDLRHVRWPHVRQLGRRPLDCGQPHGRQSRPGRPDRCQAHGGRWSAGCHRGCGRGRAGRCSRLCGRSRLPATLPAMICVARPGRSGGSRCGTHPAWPSGKRRSCLVRQTFRGGLQCHGRQTIPGRHPFRGGLRFRELYPFPVRPLPRCPGRVDSRPGCRSEPHLSPRPGNRTLPGHAARAPHRVGCLTCWRGGPCLLHPWPVRYRPGLGRYRRADPFQCCLPARGP